MSDEQQIANEPQTASIGNRSRKKTMLLVVGIIAIGAVMTALRQNPQQCGCLPFITDSTWQATKSGEMNAAGRPRLLDLGATKCIPCKKMAPILEELKQEYAGRMDVEFIDVWQNRDAAGRYGLESIPTQIFFSAAGKELYRHQGFFAKDDILNKWKDLGVDLAD